MQQDHSWWKIQAGFQKLQTGMQFLHTTCIPVCNFGNQYDFFADRLAKLAGITVLCMMRLCVIQFLYINLLQRTLPHPLPPPGTLRRGEVTPSWQQFIQIPKCNICCPPDPEYLSLLVVLESSPPQRRSLSTRSYFCHVMVYVSLSRPFHPVVLERPLNHQGGYWYYLLHLSHHRHLCHMLPWCSAALPLPYYNPSITKTDLNYLLHLGLAVCLRDARDWISRECKSRTHRCLL